MNTVEPGGVGGRMNFGQVSGTFHRGSKHVTRAQRFSSWGKGGGTLTS